MAFLIPHPTYVISLKVSLSCSIQSHILTFSTAFLFAATYFSISSHAYTRSRCTNKVADIMVAYKPSTFTSGQYAPRCSRKLTRRHTVFTASLQNSFLLLLLYTSIQLNTMALLCHLYVIVPPVLFSGFVNKCVY
jgi:hypothetical protein